MNISAVIARHKSIFGAVPALQKETSSINVEVPKVKEIPTIPLPKVEGISRLNLTAPAASVKDLYAAKALIYPTVESSSEPTSFSSFGEEEMLRYLRRERSYFPQNMEVDSYN